MDTLKSRLVVLWLRPGLTGSVQDEINTVRYTEGKTVVLSDLKIHGKKKTTYCPIHTSQCIPKC